LNRKVIIVAGGMGKRLQPQSPKQFLALKGEPILMHTISKFHKFDNALELIVVLPAPYVDFWKSLCRRHNFNIPHRVTIGGKTRYHSVKKGLELIEDFCLVAIHDGVRPLVSTDTISKVFKKAAKAGNGIPMIKINDSIRKSSVKGFTSVDRSDYRLIQTPQCFQASMLKKAYTLPFDKKVSDDASLVEAAGYELNFVEGNTENIKITRPVDLKIATALLK